MPRVDTDQADLKSAAMEAWIYALPLIEVEAVRTRGLAFGNKGNVLRHARNLSSHRARAVTTPNNDTLYSIAHLDLTHDPVTLVIPPTGDRYVSVALMDAYTNNFAVLGTRTTGGDGGQFRLVGPKHAIDESNTIRAPTPHVWLLVRVLVDGVADLDAARIVQAGFTIQGPEVVPLVVEADRTSEWRIYFAAAARLMAANPPPVTDLRMLNRIEAFGLGRNFEPERFNADQITDIEAGVADARDAVRRAGIGGFVDGWAYPHADIGDFGQGYFYRAVVGLCALAALPPAEAMYMLAEGERGGVYNGLEMWRLHFAADQLPPVNGFWSLSLYEATDDGQFFFTENPLGRYAIGDRTENLTFNPDGSLDVWIGHESPGSKRETNWLPAPSGPFALFMRTYLPRPELLNGEYRLPRVRRLDVQADDRIPA